MTKKVKFRMPFTEQKLIAIDDIVKAVYANGYCNYVVLTEKLAYWKAKLYIYGTLDSKSTDQIIEMGKMYCKDIEDGTIAADCLKFAADVVSTVDAYNTYRSSVSYALEPIISVFKELDLAQLNDALAQIANSPLVSSPDAMLNTIFNTKE